MKGSQLSLYIANQGHRKSGKTVVDWLLKKIDEAGIHGATVTEVSEGLDAHGRFHAARFFELADQSVAVTVAAADDRIDALLASLRGQGVRLFYIRAPVEFELLGESDDPAAS